MLFKATIEVLYEAGNEAEACDAIAEPMRGLLREFGGDAAPFIDWRYAGPEGNPTPNDGEGFEYAP